MKHIALLTSLALLAGPLTSTAQDIRAGIIGLDTSHVLAFTKILNTNPQKPEVMGVRMVAAYAQGSKDIESSVKRVPEYTEKVKAMGVEIVDSIEKLCEKVDVVFLETNDGRPKRWVVVRPRGAVTGILLARADGAEQSAVVGNQTASRVGFFLRVDDFDATRSRLDAAGVEFVSPVREMPYGRVTVFVDVAGNRWDLLGE